MSDIKNLIIENAKNSVQTIITASKYIPADKLTWTPGGEARSTLALLQECTTFPAWIIDTINTGAMSQDQTLWDEVAKIDSYDAIIAKLNEETAKLVKYIEEIPEDKLSQTITFPWETTTVTRVLGYHSWNCTYHLGQINYMQLILGDKEMHVS